MMYRTDKSIAKVLASRVSGPLCLAVTMLCAPPLQAQASHGPQFANASQPTPASGSRGSDEYKGLAQGTADVRASERRIEALLAENKLRDKFNAFDYTDELPPNLNFAEFERSLEQRFFGTYVFYAKLTGEQRMRVYESYRRDRHISSIRTSTLDLLH